MSGGLRYRIARWAERRIPRLALRFEGIGPTGRHVYRNIIGGYWITKGEGE